MLFGIETRKLARRLRSACKENLTVDLFTVKDVARVPTSPGPNKVCPPPTYEAVRILKVNGSVKLMLTNEKTVEVPIAQIGGIRTKTKKATAITA